MCYYIIVVVVIAAVIVEIKRIIIGTIQCNCNVDVCRTKRSHQHTNLTRNFLS